MQREKIVGIVVLAAIGGPLFIGAALSGKPDSRVTTSSQASVQYVTPPANQYVEPPANCVTSAAMFIKHGIMRNDEAEVAKYLAKCTRRYTTKPINMTEQERLEWLDFYRAMTEPERREWIACLTRRESGSTKYC
jgi:hypothetical protein